MDKTTALHSLLGWAASLTLVTVAAVLASPATTGLVDSVPVLAGVLRAVDLTPLPSDLHDGWARRLSVLRAFVTAGPSACCHRG